MRSGFFENTDILAEDFATAFGGILTSGVLMATDTNALLVEAATGMNVTVNPGFCWINGHYAEAPENETLAIELSDGTYNRIDRIVVRLDIAEHNISLMVITGTPASSPVAPAIVRNGSYYDLSLATVNVTCGTIEISSAMITDTRLNDTTCGIVQCTAAEIDVEDLFEQYRVQLVAMMTTDQALFTTWFAHLQTELDSNQAAHLLSLIDNNTADITELETKTAALTDEGDGTEFLADDGTYKPLSLPFVTGIMTANGTIDLGFTPSAVMVTGENVMESPLTYNYSKMFAFALPNHDYNVAGSATLHIIDNGFTTINMSGISGQVASASYPLRYIAFK